MQFQAAKAIDLDVGMDRDTHARLMNTRGVKLHPFQHPALTPDGERLAAKAQPYFETLSKKLEVA